MKIGILTQPLSNNYGGILQAHALQTLLRSMGHEPEIINRQSAYPPASLVARRFLSLIKCVIRRYVLGNKNVNISNPFYENYTLDKGWTFDCSELSAFIDNEIRQSRPLRSSEAVAKYAKKQQFDCFIVGSDQVWREKYSSCITDYFLGFLPDDYKAKRIVYGASFGTEHDPIPSKLDECVKLARQFDAISVREESGVRLMKEIFGLDARLVLDPTLLMDAGHYRALIKKEDVKKSGVVSYILDETAEKQNIIDDVTNKVGSIYTRILLFPFRNRCENPKSVSISQWLAAIDNADFVVTDSFHGCVFSIIFKKKFVAIGNKERGLDRFISLLGRLGLQDRLVCSLEEFECRKDALMTAPDYAAVDLKLDNWRKDSLDFLNKALS